MKVLRYQFKNICRDKMCILSFLLPVLAGLAVNLFSGIEASSLSETDFCVVKDDITGEAGEWLQKYGRVTVLPDIAALKNRVNDPATQGIGVLQDGDGIRTLLSGDELQVFTVIGNTLPWLYAQRNSAALPKVTVVPAANNRDALKSLLIVITMVTAMFMGCTFNAMNIIGEKEEGISLINEVLPMTKKEYVVQKITLGFMGGASSALLTACVCMKITAGQILPLLAFLVLSAFVSALAGLFIGRFSSGLMAGIVYIKITMLVFLAPPILFYLVVPPESILFSVSYLLPSSAAFYGLMGLTAGTEQNMGVNLVILSAHCILWFLLFLFTDGRKQNRFPA